jgi:hypothetical protein
MGKAGYGTELWDGTKPGEGRMTRKIKLYDGIVCGGLKASAMECEYN